VRWRTLQHRRSLVTRSRTRIGEIHSRNRKELPAVHSSPKRQFQNTKSLGDSNYFTVRRVLNTWSHNAIPSSSDNELANSAKRIGVQIRILRCKALVKVLMPVDHDLRTCSIQPIP